MRSAVTLIFILTLALTGCSGMPGAETTPESPPAVVDETVTPGPPQEPEQASETAEQPEASSTPVPVVESPAEPTPEPEATSPTPQQSPSNPMGEIDPDDHAIGGYRELPSDRPLTRIAFGSCAREDRPQPIWDAVLAQEPQLFIFAGDNVYADTEDMNAMRAAYSELAARPGFRKLKAATPILATWDDHDYGVNDGGKHYAARAESQQVFLDFWGVPADSARREREGVYHSVIAGPVGQRTQIILLDTRYHRDDLELLPANMRRFGRYAEKDDPDATMLGDEQWEWLAEQLRKPAELRIIVSSIQVVAEEHGWERWAELPWQREKLFETIREARAERVIFLSGDRHHGELSVCHSLGDYPALDLTASGLNQAVRREIDERNHHRIGKPVTVNHLGMINIDWAQEDPIVRLRLIDEQQRNRLDHTINTRGLTFPETGDNTRQHEPHHQPPSDP
ncbi:alkaline phosphatase D family protein [Mucisphaera calidilacus]|uniref:Alkaline phosphatase D n=1 Tax=Mucisphaera calidilacus TaxID=2527982 RepID=A0A518BWC9_9BACT|nr:alkaline phosphatase D family protein [Mucisphaera calidilacus]QDU71289.1 Alkaline phosphatase D precursor [Mucisphaera calidilacus]